MSLLIMRAEDAHFYGSIFLSDKLKISGLDVLSRPYPTTPAGKTHNTKLPHIPVPDHPNIVAACYLFN
jgi:hypothetical protein